MVLSPAKSIKAYVAINTKYDIALTGGERRVT